MSNVTIIDSFWYKYIYYQWEKGVKSIKFHEVDGGQYNFGI